MAGIDATEEGKIGAAAVCHPAEPVIVIPDLARGRGGRGGDGIDGAVLAVGMVRTGAPRGLASGAGVFETMLHVGVAVTSRMRAVSAATVGRRVDCKFCAQRQTSQRLLSSFPSYAISAASNIHRLCCGSRHAQRRLAAKPPGTQMLARDECLLEIPGLAARFVM